MPCPLCSQPCHGRSAALQKLFSSALPRTLTLSSWSCWASLFCACFRLTSQVCSLLAQSPQLGSFFLEQPLYSFCRGGGRERGGQRSVRRRPGAGRRACSTHIHSSCTRACIGDAVHCCRVAACILVNVPGGSTVRSQAKVGTHLPLAGGSVGGRHSSLLGGQVLLAGAQGGRGGAERPLSGAAGRRGWRAATGLRGRAAGYEWRHGWQATGGESQA